MLSMVEKEDERTSVLGNAVELLEQHWNSLTSGFCV